MSHSEFLSWEPALNVLGIVDYIFRVIGWGIIKILGSLVDTMYSISKKIFDLLGFIESNVLKDLMGEYYPVVKALFLVSITALGIWLLFNKIDDGMNMAQNILIIMLVVTCMPAFTGKVMNLADASINFAQSTYTKGQDSVFLDVVKDNVLDLKMIDAKYGKEDGGFSIKYKTVDNKRAKYNHIDTEKDIEALDPVETIDYDDSDTKSDAFSKRWLPNGIDGKYEEVDLESGIFSWDEYYCRYDINFWTLIFTFIGMSIGLVFASIRSAYIIFEVGWNQTLAPFFAVTDVVKGQRIKQLLIHIVSLIATLFLIAAMIGLYIVSIKYAGDITDRMGKAGSVVNVLAVLALTWLLINGPDIIERIIGVDAGVRSGHAMIMSIFGATKTAQGVAKAGKKMVGKPAGKALGFSKSNAKDGVSSLPLGYQSRMKNKKASDKKTNLKDNEKQAGGVNSNIRDSELNNGNIEGSNIDGNSANVSNGARENNPNLKETEAKGQIQNEPIDKDAIQSTENIKGSNSSNIENGNLKETEPTSSVSTPSANVSQETQGGSNLKEESSKDNVVHKNNGNLSNTSRKDLDKKVPNSKNIESAKIHVSTKDASPTGGKVTTRKNGLQSNSPLNASESNLQIAKKGKKTIKPISEMKKPETISSSKTKEKLDLPENKKSNNLKPPKNPKKK